jgi:hypothetical protein
MFLPLTFLTINKKATFEMISLSTCEELLYCFKLILFMVR